MVDNEKKIVAKATPNSIKMSHNGDETIYHLSFNIVHTINETEVIETLKHHKTVTRVSWSAL